jgi:prepilin peptidase CpaA
MLYSVQLAASLVLASLAVSDWRFRRLSNRSVLLVAGLYLVSVPLARTGTAEFAQHLLLAAAVLAVCVLLFALGWIGGGDAKLAPAIFLWSGPVLAVPVLLVVSLCGLVLGVAALAVGAWRRRAALSGAGTTQAAAPTVPYGIALALGGALAVWGPLCQAAMTR